MIGVDSVVFLLCCEPAYFRDEKLEWDRLLPADDDRPESACVGERDGEDLISRAPAALLGPVGVVADESKVFIMACSSP